MGTGILEPNLDLLLGPFITAAEFRDLLRTETFVDDGLTPRKALLLALCCRLAYCAIPSWEIDDRGTKVVPCQIHQDLIRLGAAVAIQRAALQAEIGEIEVIELPPWIVITIQKQHTQTIVAIRGTKTLADFRQDLWVPRFALDSGARVHAGFAEFALMVLDSLAGAQLLNRREPIVFTGHSLGGAIAAIARHILDFDSKVGHHTVTFGAPRLGNRDTIPISDQIAHVVRPLDFVPDLPPWPLPYAPHQSVFLLHRDRLGERREWSKGGWLRLGSLIRPLQNHGIESYLRDLTTVTRLAAPAT